MSLYEEKEYQRRNWNENAPCMNGKESDSLFIEKHFTQLK